MDLQVILINTASCPPIISGPNFFGICHNAEDSCQVSCDEGYYAARGDGVFSCLYGAWMGELKCVPFDCGRMLDGMDDLRSAFVPCTGGTHIAEMEAHFTTDDKL